MIKIACLIIENKKNIYNSIYFEDWFIAEMLIGLQFLYFEYNWRV